MEDRAPVDIEHDSVPWVAYELISRQIIIIATVTNKRDRRTLAFVIALEIHGRESVPLVNPAIDSKMERTTERENGR